MPSFVAAMKNTFARPGETLTEFSAEMKTLDEADRKWYSDALNEAGIEHDAPATRAA